MKFEDVESSRLAYIDGLQHTTDLSTRTELYSKYKKTYKAYFISCQLQAFFHDLKYDQNKGILKELLSSTGLIYTGGNYQANDLVTGKYHDIDFSQSDVTIIEQIKNNVNDSLIGSQFCTLFKGRFLIFKFPKELKGRLVVIPTYSEDFMVDPIINAGLHYFETESTTFNNWFRVYADDGFEVFYVLNPAFMEKVEQLNKKHHDKIALYYIGGEMILSINDGNDSFEPPDPTLPLNEEHEREKVINDMRLIIDIVNHLDL